MGESVRSKHTPGPWNVRETKFFNVPRELQCLVVGTDDISICRMTASEGVEGHRHAMPDARLIAAAPELLEAVERLLIGAAACAIPHPKEREVLQMAVDFAIQAKRKAKGGA